MRVEGLLDAAALERVREAVAPFERATEAFLRGREDGRLAIAEVNTITFSVNVASRSEPLSELASGPALCDVVHDLMGPDVRLLWDQVVTKKAGASRPFPCHQDNGYGFVVPETYLTCWLALDDATLENGCPRVFPGLHRRGTYLHRETEDGFALDLDGNEATPVTLRAGDLLAFSSLLPHTTGPNSTGRDRRAYILQYATEDAVYLHGSPSDGPPTGREAVRDLPATRQWPVLRGGKRVAHTLR